MDKPGHVSLVYKNWSTDEMWHPQAEDDALEIFKLDSEGKQMIPPGGPEIVAREYERKNTMQDIKKTIEGVRLFLNYEENQWWETFLDNPGSIYQQERWEWYLDCLRPQICQEAPEGIEDVAFSPLHLAMEKERHTPVVYTGKKTAKKKPPTPSKCKKTVESKLGYMVAADEEGEFYVGKISAVGNQTVDIELYTGSLTGTWKQATSPHGKCYKKTIQKASIMDDMFFTLTPSGNLPSHMRTKLRLYL